MLKYLLFIFIATATQYSFGQDHINKDSINRIVVNKFINDVANPEINPDIIISQYIIIDQPGDELYDYLEASLEEVRLNLSSKKMEEINYIPYNSLPKKETKDIDLEGNNPQQIYFIKHKERLVASLLIEESKIKSFTLVSKGNGRASFVTY